MSYIPFIILSVLIFVSMLINFYLAIQLRHLRIRANKLLEEKAKALEEADHYAELANNPLGPIMNKNAQPLILSFDEKGTITDINQTLLEKLKFKKSELIGKNIIGTILPHPKKLTENIVYRLFKNPNLFIDTETQTLTKSGETIWISWTNKMEYTAKGKAIAATAVGFDITKRKEMEAKLKYLSSIDPQTGVMNRKALLTTSEIELKRAKRYHRTLSVAVLKFEAENTLSDEQLQNIVALTRECIRSVDYLGRIDDTEFALVLPETSEENIQYLINRLSQQIEESNKKTKEKISVKYATASYKKTTDNIDNLLTQAWKKVNATTQKKSKK